MANSDGRVVLSTQVDTSGVAKATKDIANEFKKASTVTKDLLKTKEAINAQIEKLKELSKAYAEYAANGDFDAAEKARDKIDILNATIAKMESALTSSSGELNSTNSDISDVENSLSELSREIQGVDDALEPFVNDNYDVSASIETLNEQIEGYKYDIDNLERAYSALIATRNTDTVVGERITEQLRELKKRLAQAESALAKMQGASESASKSFKKHGAIIGETAKNINKKIAQVAKRMLTYTLIYKTLREIINVFADVIKSDEAFMQDVNELKAAFYSVAYSLKGVVLPVLETGVSFLRDWLVSIGKIAAAIQGITYSELLEQAEASKKIADNYDSMSDSAKETQKTLAGFDDIQILSDGTSESGSDDYAGFEGLGASAAEDTESPTIISMLEAIVTTVEGALIAIGLILLVHGNIPIGLGAIVAGLILRSVQEAANTEYSTDPVVNMLAKITKIAGTALLALGVILLASGNIPLGLGAIIGGIGILAVGEVAANWDEVPDETREFVSTMLAIVGTATLVLGIILVATGVGIPLGIGLILAGVVSLVSTVTLNKNAILDTIKNIWNKIKEFWKNHIAVIFTAAFWKNLIKTAGNAVITCVENVLNFLTGGIRKFINGAGDLIESAAKLLGININIPSIPEIKLPRLAQGAVIPANREFLAVLGDQKSGTNIEAPAELIKQMVLEAMAENGYRNNSQTEVILTVDGREFGRAVVDLGRKEERRIGTQLAVV